MNNKNLVLILVLIAIAAISIVAILLTYNQKKNSQNKVIIESSQVSNAYGFAYAGTVICGDGSIYDFELTDSKYENIDKLTLTQRSILILESGTKREETVEEQDLKKIKKLLPKIKADYKERNAEMQIFNFGTESVHIYNYKKNEKVILLQTGAVLLDNNSKKTAEILEILGEYLRIPEDIVFPDKIN